MNGIKKENRRHGPDTMVKAINIFAGITWLLVFLVFIFITYAKPRVSTMFDDTNNIMGNQAWDKSMLGYVTLLLFVLVIVCFIGILINMNRHKRKSDRYNKSLLFFGIGSLLGILYYFIFV